MKSLTKFIFCIFVITIFHSCEPQEIEDELTVKQNIPSEIQPIGDTGGNEEDVYVEKNKN